MKTLRQALSMLPVVFTCTAWKMSKYEVIFGPYFPAFGLNTERYSVFSPNAGIYGPEITPYLDTFHAVLVLFSCITPCHINKEIFHDPLKLIMIKR